MSDIYAQDRERTNLKQQLYNIYEVHATVMYFNNQVCY